MRRTKLIPVNRLILLIAFFKLQIVTMISLIPLILTSVIENRILDGIGNSNDHWFRILLKYRQENRVIMSKTQMVCKIDVPI